MRTSLQLLALLFPVIPCYLYFSAADSIGIARQLVVDFEFLQGFSPKELKLEGLARAIESAQSKIRNRVDLNR